LRSLCAGALFAPVARSALRGAESKDAPPVLVAPYSHLLPDMQDLVQTS
jgi:hypothetical protein